MKIVSASAEIHAPADRIFELVADPSRQPEWDGNDNLAEAPEGQRVTAVGDVFTMLNTSGKTRDNHVVEFAEGRVIAWKPASPGKPPAGHVWKWEFEPLDEGRTRVTHTYDWTELTDENRMAKARSTTSEMLAASIARLKEKAEER